MKLLPYEIMDRSGKPHARVQVRGDDVREFSPEDVRTSQFAFGLGEIID